MILDAYLLSVYCWDFLCKEIYNKWPLWVIGGILFAFFGMTFSRWQWLTAWEEVISNTLPISFIELYPTVLKKFVQRFTPNRVQRWVLSLLLPALAALQRILESARAFLHRPSDHQELIPENQAIPENEEIQENGEENQAIQENNEEEFDP